MKKVLFFLIAGLMIFFQTGVLAEPTPPAVSVAYTDLAKVNGPTSSAVGDGSLPNLLVPRVVVDSDFVGPPAPPAQPSAIKSLRVAPRQGYVDSMSTQESVDVLNLGLKGKVTLYLTGVAMTEPAVSAGLAAANEYSNQQLDRSLKTYDLVTNAAKDSGSLSSMQLLSELSTCVAKKATENKTHDVGFIVDACLAKDKAKESEQVASAKRRTDNDGAGVNTTFTGN